IAAKNGVVCPYGPYDRAEWNHCQPTSIKIITAGNPLRETVSATGPLDLAIMFEAGGPMIDDMASAADSLGRATPTRVHMLEAAASGAKRTPVLVRHATRRNPPVASVRHVAAKPVRHAKLGPHIGAARMPPTEDNRARSRLHAAMQPMLDPEQKRIGERGKCKQHECNRDHLLAL